MSSDEKTDAPTKRRISGEAFWRLKGLLKKIDDAQAELKKWRESKLEEMKKYPDQVNWAVGSIYDPLVEIRDEKVVNAKVIERLPYELLIEHRNKAREIETLGADLEQLRDDLARKLNTWPDAISVRDGVVDAGSLEAVDPDAPKDEKQPEPAAVAAE